MAEEFTGTGLTPPKSLGWNPSPEVSALNAESQTKHIQEYTPIVEKVAKGIAPTATPCLLYTSPSPRDYAASRMPSSA